MDRAAMIAVGVSVPAPVDSTTGVAGASTTLPWAGARPAAELERRLGLPVVVDNDANVAALGESTRGVARDAPDMVYVKFATGIGPGIILGGRLYRGASGIAGEIGHVIADPDGVVCRCGNRGCRETVAAAPALVDLLRRSYGADFSAAEMLAGSAVGNVACRRVMADAGRAIGRALADLVTCLKPSLIVVGCHPDAAAEPQLNGIREAIGRYALPAAVQACPSPPEPSGSAPRCSEPWPS